MHLHMAVYRKKQKTNLNCKNCSYAANTLVLVAYFHASQTQIGASARYLSNKTVFVRRYCRVTVIASQLHLLPAHVPLKWRHTV